MRRAKGINDPVCIIPMSNQRTDADDWVIDVFGNFIAHGGTDFVFALAVMLAAAKPLMSGTVSMSQTMMFVRMNRIQ
jgi:hypothetical protein